MLIRSRLSKIKHIKIGTQQLATQRLTNANSFAFPLLYTQYVFYELHLTYCAA
jgi:hypothetical protein